MSFGAAKFRKARTRIENHKKQQSNILEHTLRETLPPKPLPVRRSAGLIKKVAAADANANANANAAVAVATDAQRRFQSKS